jgi:uncharacterized protein (TIGR03437 family)
LPEANPQISFGGVPLAAENILYIGAAPSAAGLWQLNMVVPSAPGGTGDREIILSVYGKLSVLGRKVPVAAP